MSDPDPSAKYRYVLSLLISVAMNLGSYRHVLSAIKMYVKGQNEINDLVILQPVCCTGTCGSHNTFWALLLLCAIAVVDMVVL